MPNQLADASSPYLRQHADNPVDWQEWGPGVFEQARERDVPIFLSIGYSSCHWCHVMAHESFSDESVAALLNAHFVPVKLDREERPDVDAVYMSAVQAITGRGGWPLNVFCTPDGNPFFGGTYWPLADRGGMPGFPAVLQAVHGSWTDNRQALLDSSTELAQHLTRAHDLGDGGSFDADIPADAAAQATRVWDDQLGGFGQAPKFPQAMLLDFLLAHHRRTGDEGALRATEHTLDAMSRGGILDQVGGGFHRYSVDARWLVPHFEKMLYDNALLLRVYVHAFQVTGRPRFRRVAAETADYLIRDLQQEQGGFSSATDADSEGVEGKFFVWTATEFDEVVAAAGEDPATWRTFFGVTDSGNWEDPHGHAPPDANILHEPVARDEEDADFAARLGAVRAALTARRAERVPPGLDDKVLVSWNALAVEALAEAGGALGEPRYVDAARRCVGFIRDHLIVEETLQHTWSPGHEPTIEAFCDDVATLSRALLVLYEADPDPGWVAWARELAEQAEVSFADRRGAYYTTAHDAEDLVVRPRDLWDNATPGAASVMVEVNARLAALTGDHSYRERAMQTLGVFAQRMQRAPTGYGELLRGAERLLGEQVEVAVVGPPSQREALLGVYRETWRPAAVLAVGDGTNGDGDSELERIVPLLAHRPAVDGQATAYVCHGFQCDRPVHDAEALRALL